MNRIYKRPVMVVNIIIVVLEIIAFIHDCMVFGPALFKWYTIDSNILQMIVSAAIVYYCVKDTELPSKITLLHFISAVGLTITFLIAAFVLAPEGGIRYYFIDNVAPINHLAGPLLSVISLLFLEKTDKEPVSIIIWPAVVSLIYGLVCIILNMCHVLEGPYFFLDVNKQPSSMTMIWFGIIAVLCLTLASLYYCIKWYKTSESSTTMEKKAGNKNGIKRLVFALFAILMEVLLQFNIIVWLNNYAEWIAIGTRLLAGILVLVIYNQNKTAAMKIPWIILIMTIPVFGVMLYTMIGLNPGMRSMRKRYIEVDAKLFPLLSENDDVIEELQAQDKAAANIAAYLQRYAHYPAYDKSDVTYYDDAAKGLEEQKKEMRKARKFIFMEYHAIENAESWQGIQAILEEKVREGVEVRVFYDDMGSIGFINTDFVKMLESKGIRCRVFNPFRVGLNLFLNNRDHRKITVIDGRTGFTGGYNLANEYFNITHPYGHWKDTGIKIQGDAVKNLTAAFLEMWNAIRGDDENDTDYRSYLPDTDYQPEEGGFILPYADSPMDDEQVGENVYISMAEYAKDYVWFITPYLILTDELIHALGLAAKRGVDVRVITPGIPDKKTVYSITRSYYHSLVKNGVRIYEYTPGFCHCKMSLADDRIATCGTINMDYRSLYHHFENGCLYYGCSAVADTRIDFENTMKECREVTQDYIAPNSGRKLVQMILRLFAPLL